MVVVRVQAHEIGGWKQKVDVFDNDDEPTLSYKQRLALFEKQPNKAPSTSSPRKTPSGPSSIKALTAGLNLRITSPSSLQSGIKSRIKPGIQSGIQSGVNIRCKKVLNLNEQI